MMIRQCLFTAFLCVGGATAVSGQSAPPARPAWEWTLEERVTRRWSKALEAELREAAVAAGHSVEDESQRVILGDRHPELLLPWELMNSLAGGAYHPARRDKYRKRWARGSEYLGEDFWTRLQAVAGPFFDAGNKLEELQLATDRASGTERPALDAEWSLVNGSICRLRSEALRAARTTFGREQFDRFLYEVVAVGAVIYVSTSSDDGEHIENVVWMEEGCP